MVADQKGRTARVTIPDVIQGNGVIMVIDKVLSHKASAALERWRSR